jgi:cytochrome P450
MFNNEADYPDPSTFNPERYLKNGQLDPSIRDPVSMAFGFGRRQVVEGAQACPFIGDRSLDVLK